MVTTIALRSGGPNREYSRSQSTLLPFLAGAMPAASVVFASVSFLGGRVLNFAAGAPALEVGRGLLAATAIAYGTSYAVARPLPLISSQRQVPQTWRNRFVPSLAAFLYGGELGLGLGTRVPFVTFYVALGAAFLIGDPIVGAVAGAFFGLGRWMPLAFYRLRRFAPDDGPQFAVSVQARKRGIQLANAALLLAVGTNILIGAF